MLARHSAGMTKVGLLLLVLLSSACMITTARRELSVSNESTIVPTPVDDDQLLRKMIEDRRTWIDPHSAF